jgi:hypothetical protein
MAELNNPTEAEVLALARAADEGVDYTSAPVAPVETSGTESEKASGDNLEQPATPETTETTETKSTSIDVVTDEVPKTETVSTKSSLTTQSDESKSESASEKKPTRYEKAKSRLEKEWETLRAEKAKLQAEREAAQASVGKAAAQEKQTSTRKFSAEDYREAAKSYRDEGRDDLAKLAENKASEIEVEYRKEQEENVKGELKSAWDKNLYEEVEANPDLKDSSTKLYKAVSEMLQNHAILRNYPAGIKDAVGIAKIRLKAESASDLEKKVAKYESELAQLRKATTPASGQPSAPARQKQFHELSSNEQEKELLRMAAEADRMGV